MQNCQENFGDRAVFDLRLLTFTLERYAANMAFDSIPGGNMPIDIPGVSDATVLLMLAELVKPVIWSPDHRCL